MPLNYDFEKHSKAYNLFESAKQIAQKDPKEAIKLIREAIIFFNELGNKDNQLAAISLEFKWLIKIDRDNFIDIYENRVLDVLDTFYDYNLNRNYILIQYNYFLQKSIKIHKEEQLFNESEALTKLIDFTTANRSILHFVPENQLQIWRSQLIALKARLSISGKDNLSTRAKYYLEAANLSIPTVEDKLANKMRITHYSHMSSYHKLKAFSYLHTGNLSIDFDEIIKSLASCIEYSQQAYELTNNKGINKHQIYMSYWLNVFSSRNQANKKQFEKSTEHLNQAIKLADHLIELNCSIFPNYFADYDDLLNDRLIVRAFELLCSNNLTKCAKKLIKWLERSRNKRGTWKYNTVNLRLIAVDFFAYLISSKNEETLIPFSPEWSASEVSDKLNALANEVKLGKASEKIMDMLILLAVDHERKQLSLENINNALEMFRSLFTTDSVVEDYESIASISFIKKPNKYDVLPELINDEFNRIQSLKEITFIFSALDNILVVYLGIIAEYHYIKYSNRNDIDNFNPQLIIVKKSFANMSLDELVDIISQLTSFNRNMEGLAFFNKYKEIRNGSDNSIDIKSLILLGKNILKTFIGLFPHIIHVVKDPLGHQTDEFYEGYFVCERLWSKAWPKTLLCSNDWPLENGKYYYLKSNWNNFNFEKTGKYRSHYSDFYESQIYDICVKRVNNILLQEQRIKLTRVYERNLNEFQILLDKNSKEDKISQFLKAHFWILGTEYKSIYSEFQINPENRSDFILKTHTNDFVIVELKQVSFNLFDNNGNKEKDLPLPITKNPQRSRLLQNSLDQLSNYQKAFQERLRNQYGTSMDNEIKGVLVIGRLHNDSERKALKDVNESELRSQRQIITYDELLLNAKGIIKCTPWNRSNENDNILYKN